MNCYLVSHNGLGDHLFMVGALRFLLNFYEKIYFVCSKSHYSNVSLFFIDTSNITCVPFECSNEIPTIINNIYNNTDYDIFICGFIIKNLLGDKTRIRNTQFLNYKCIDKGYTIDYDFITTTDYNFIENFYNDIGLNLTYYFDYFFLPSTKESIELYNSIKSFKIIFIQLKIYHYHHRDNIF